MYLTHRHDILMHHEENMTMKVARRYEGADHEAKADKTWDTRLDAEVWLDWAKSTRENQ